MLLRTTQNWAQNFLEILWEGIPAYADAGTGYFEAVEVSMFLNLLRIIDNRQDIHCLVLCVLPLGFTIEELIDIRIHDKCGSIMMQ